MLTLPNTLSLWSWLKLGFPFQSLAHKLFNYQVFKQVHRIEQ